MKKDAETHAGEDAKKREAVEAKNLAEQLIYTAEKALRDAGEKVPAELRKGIEDKISDLKTAKDGTDAERIKSATQSLSSEIQKIGQYMAQNQQKQEGPNPPPADGQGNVRDAETK